MAAHQTSQSPPSAQPASAAAPAVQLAVAVASSRPPPSQKPNRPTNNFNQLLAYLEAEHERQLAELRSENERLKQRVGIVGSASEDRADDLAVQMSPAGVGIDGTGVTPFMFEEKRGAEGNFSRSSKQSQEEAALQEGRMVKAIGDLQKITSELAVHVNFLIEESQELEEEEEERTTPAFMNTVNSVDSMEASDKVEKPAEFKNFSEWWDYQFKKWGKILTGEKFEMLVGALILLNTAVMAFEMQYHGLQCGWEIGYPQVERSAEESWPGGEVVFPLLEKVFTLIFCVEVLIKLFFLRMSYVRNPMNWLDIVVVVVGAVDWMLSELQGASFKDVLNPMVIRMLRLAKLARGLRMMKMTKVLDSLSLLLKCIAASLVTLFWSLCLLFVVQCIAGMIISQMVEGFMKDETKDIEERHKVYMYYGTFTRSMLTMFEITMANWAPACRVLVNNISEWYTAYFLFYRCIVGFAVLGVITAVFIQQTMQTAAKDNDVMIRRKQKESDDYKRKLWILFQGMDESGDGFLSYDEFAAMLAKPEMKNWMSALDIDPSDVQSLFNLMARDDGTIGFEEFLEGAGRLKGQAKSLDMAKMTQQISRIEEKLNKKFFSKNSRRKSSISTVASAATGVSTV